MQRRSFLKAGASLAASIALPAARPGALAAKQNVASTVGGSHSRSFPKGFRWNTATASYQVEGAVQEEGRGPSVWDTFSQTPGNTRNGDIGNVADDHLPRYKENIALVKSLGVNSYHFSIVFSLFLLNAKGSRSELIGGSKRLSLRALSYGSIALHRGAYQSSSIDDDHTAHLVTDGFYDLPVP